jgi:hypothetical protein
LAAGFAKTEAVEPKLRAELLAFAKDMELLAIRREANGNAEESTEGDESCVF